MKIAIIGCGYVGTAVARHFSQLGNVVTVTTTTPDRIQELEAVSHRVAVVKGNDASTLKSVLENQETVLLSVGATKGNPYEEVYLQTAKTLVSLLSENSSVRQLIYTGSCAVYGDKKGAWVDEDSRAVPTNEKGEVLSNTEQTLLSASSKSLRVCILRLGGIYGPGREIIKIFSRAAGTTRPGDGNEATNWVHLEDIVGAIAKACDRQLQGIYNVVDDEELTRRELLDRLFETHNLPKITWDATADSQRSYNARVSNQKIKDAGYQFIHPQRLL